MMFGKKKHRTNVNATDTLIGEGTTVEGKIITSASLRIEGKVIGDIECTGDITIGEKGHVHSIINARNVFNAGTVKGSINAKGKLTITSKGVVDGSINVASLHISEGGVFRGDCSMETAERKEPQRSSSSKHDRHHNHGGKGKHEDKASAASA